MWSRSPGQRRAEAPVAVRVLAVDDPLSAFSPEKLPQDKAMR